MKRKQLQELLSSVQGSYTFSVALPGTAVDACVTKFNMHGVKRRIFKIEALLQMNISKKNVGL
jgi:hypothetical protein